MEEAEKGGRVASVALRESADVVLRSQNVRLLRTRRERRADVMPPGRMRVPASGKPYQRTVVARSHRFIT
jgi:hypothetical protein